MCMCVCVCFFLCCVWLLEADAECLSLLSLVGADRYVIVLTCIYTYNNRHKYTQLYTIY
jgi:hypothetical protein